MAAAIQSRKVKKVLRIGLVVELVVGMSIGIFEAIGGIYVFDCFRSIVPDVRAMFITTALLALRYGLIALLEIPAGAFADAIGRVHVVVLSFALRSGFFLCIAALALKGPLYAMLVWGIIGSMFWSASYTFFTGSFTAWCVDSIRDDAPDIACAGVVSRMQSYLLGGGAIGTLIGILCYVSGATVLLFLLSCLLSFGLIGFCIRSMSEPRSIRFLRATDRSVMNTVHKMRSLIVQGARICWQKPPLLWLIMLFGSYMALLNLVMFLWPIYFKERTALSHFGLHWCLLALMIVGLRALSARALVSMNNAWESEQTTRRHKEHFWKLLFRVSLAAIASVLILSATVIVDWHVLVVMAGTVSIVCMGYGYILGTYETLVNVYIPPNEAQQRATIISAGSMFRSFLAMLLSVPAGVISVDRNPIYWAVPAIVLLVGVLGAYLVLRKESVVAAAPSLAEI